MHPKKYIEQTDEAQISIDNQGIFNAPQLDPYAFEAC